MQQHVRCHVYEHALERTVVEALARGRSNAQLHAVLHLQALTQHVRRGVLERLSTHDNRTTVDRRPPTQPSMKYHVLLHGKRGLCRRTI